LDGTFLALEHLGEEYTNSQKCNILLKTLPQHIRKNIREDINITNYVSTHTKLSRYGTAWLPLMRWIAKHRRLSTAWRNQKSQPGQQKLTQLTPEEHA
jgi:hypothetical protein